ncbi:MAG TPA: serine/threonine-protein kinase [Gemmataceae bacterium]|nr:serine/threonine-protein kinase [Gemmataceae bacterium]
MTHDPNGDREERLNKALLAYVEARETGRNLDRNQLLASHPDLRGDLEEFFAGHDEVERLAVALREGGEPEVEPRTGTGESAPEIGELGDFRLLREIGRGGMGVVYEAEQISLRRRVALKVLPFAAALDPRQLQRFKNEALAAAHLRHENIVPVYMVGEERGVHYYAMQFIEGRSLANLIAEMKLQTPEAPNQAALEIGKREMPATTLAAVLSTERSSSSRRYYEWVARLGRQAALALEHAHSVGIVHRDVKPANLLLDPGGRLWVTDFGLAQMAGSAALTVTGELLGTIRYASPEQVLARQGVVDHRSDVYSLGATLYELLTMRPLFDGRDRNELLRQIARDEPRPPRSIHPSVPRELETVVLKALGKESSERYLTARELADDLQRFLDNRPVLGRRPTPVERLWKLARRHPSVVATVLVVMLLLLAGSLLSTFLIQLEQGRTRTAQQRAEEAYRQERQRAEEAEARFLLARRCVDEMFRISQEELADLPALQGPRKRLLRSVLGYYQEFLEQRRDDAEAQADLLDAKQRVENILADLAVLRAASQLYLLCQPAVLDELHLSGEQRPKVREFCARVGKEWVESLADVGRLPHAERARRAVERARRYQLEVNQLLSESQRLRLRQIGLQAEGPVAFGDAEVVSELKLSREQRERIRMIEEEAAFGWMKKQPENSSKDPRSEGRSVNERILAVLTEEQLRRWREMTGEPMKAPLTPFFSPARFGSHGQKITAR